MPLSDVIVGNTQPNDLALTSDKCLDTATFTAEQELKYARRYEEGYDLPDKHYETWLKINHPESPKADSTQQVPSLSGNISPSPKNQNGPQTGSADNATSRSECPSPASVISNKSPAVVQRSPLSQLLNIPVADKPKKKVTTGKACVLTSAECLKALQDKENEKVRKAEELEQRKKERLLKKQLKEEELKCKKEEKEHKAALKEAKLLEKQSKKPTRGKKCKHTSSIPNVATDNLTFNEATDDPPADAATDDVAEESTHSDKGPSKRKSTDNVRSNAKRLKHSVDDEIDVNRCCVCFGMYADDAGTGREWLECRCSRWIHEDCIDNDDVDIEQCIFCPLC